MPGCKFDASTWCVRFALFLAAVLSLATIANAQPSCTPSNTILANVAAIDQPFMLNRLGASMPQGMIFALLQDVVPKPGSSGISAGKVMLRSDKRPRPMVLRMDVGQCMQVNFWNLLSRAQDPAGLQPATREAGVHAQGMQLFNAAAPLQPAAPFTNGINNDGSFVGVNPSSLVSPLTKPFSAQQPQATYVFYAAHDGAFLLYSMGATFGSGGGDDGAQLGAGLFGAVNVQPPGGEVYRSQVTNQELQFAFNGVTPDGHPTINYAARFPPNTKINGIDWSCKPVLAMIAIPTPLTNGTCPPVPYAPSASAPMQVFYTDLTAMITGPNAGNFSGTGPWFNPVTAEPNRKEPYREFTIIYHDVPSAIQAFRNFYPPPTPSPSPTPQWDNISSTVGGGNDSFAINYGTGGIAAEILANRFSVGPMWDCPECKFEEFFLSAWAMGDPATVVDIPADFPAGTLPSKPNVLSPFTQQMEGFSVVANGGSCPQGFQCGSPAAPGTGPKAKAVFFPDDPSNVYHSYLNDHVTFRILHAGALLTHVHHQHAHQWLHTPDDQNGSYLDSQMISPGGTYSLEIDYNGSGNRNKTVGDSIFHCHFYPHFAQGMWSMWRVHDVFEFGTGLSTNPKTPYVAETGSRALPDGEISTGAPIPAIVPIPTLAMAPIPGYVQIQNGQMVYGGTCQNSQVNGIQVQGGCSNGQQLNGQVVVASNQGNIQFQFKTTSSLVNPGYPFFISGIAGHRPPHPPFDFACQTPALGGGCVTYYDGGLPRHVITSHQNKTSVPYEQHNIWDFTKDNVITSGSTTTGALQATQLPENGTPVEQVAMQFMGTRQHSSFTPQGTSSQFITNGLPCKPPSCTTAQNQWGSQQGAPFADPAVGDNGEKLGNNTRSYRAADVQMDVVFNKKGWHFPQERFITLWEDVEPTMQGHEAPEPFFFRANSRQDVISFWLTNLVPSNYLLDDFQVQTPTDIIGEHIHLVKFDVLASDGAANGFNYEDGSLSPQEVQDRITAIKNTGGSWNTQTYCSAGGLQCPPLRAPQPPPSEICGAYGQPACPAAWAGAQTTVQRWYPDELTGCYLPPCTTPATQNGDRTLRTVFTHDHFSPSTHQQAGLYAGLLVEPEASTWTLPNGTPLGTRPDGGPTSWNANVIAGIKGADSFREFALEFADTALAYTGKSIPSSVAPPPPASYPSGSSIGSSMTPFGWADCADAIGSNFLVPGIQTNTPSPCVVPPSPPGGINILNPGIISATLGTGTAVVNYRNEPVPFRVYDKNCDLNSSNQGTCHDTTNPKTDLAYAFSSQVARLDTDLNTQPPLGTLVDNVPGRFFPGPEPPGTSVQNLDPYTPLLRAYQNDPVQVRLLVGAYVLPHDFAMHGLKWFFEPSNSNSGYRDNQEMGISEHFEMQFQAPSTAPPGGASGTPYSADYLYMTGEGTSDQAQGLWGLLRTYNQAGTGKPLSDLKPLPNNQNMGSALPVGCPANALATREYWVAAVNFPNGITYNSRDAITNLSPGGALVYVQTGQNFTNIPTTPPANPLILRANAGDCVQVHLLNNFQPSTSQPIFNTFDASPPAVCNTQATTSNPTPVDFAECSPLLFPSSTAGLHAQMLSYDVTQNDGANVGLNPVQTVAPSYNITYNWYAGNVTLTNGQLTGTPVELGSANLLTADSLEQQPYSMVGALIIEPQGSTWPTNGSTTADITVNGNVAFREFVAIMQDNLRLSNSTQAAAVNYGTEPMANRFNLQGSATFDSSNISAAFSDCLVPKKSTKPIGEPLTPIFQADPGTPVRFRWLHPDGQGAVPDGIVSINGHVWPEEPYINNSTQISAGNPTSQWLGSHDGFGPGQHYEVVIPSAGGEFKVPGDYLYQSFTPADVINGVWGVFRVGNSSTPSCGKAHAVAATAPAAAKANAGAVNRRLQRSRMSQLPSQNRNSQSKK